VANDDETTTRKQTTARDQTTSGLGSGFHWCYVFAVLITKEVEPLGGLGRERIPDHLKKHGGSGMMDLIRFHSKVSVVDTLGTSLPLTADLLELHTNKQDHQISLDIFPSKISLTWSPIIRTEMHDPIKNQI
jgi:hypothetical protein